MKKIILIFFISLLSVSCNDYGLNEVIAKKDEISNGINSDNTISEKTLDSTKRLSKVIVPLKAECGYKDVIVWGIDHYQSKSGKYLGIWTGLKSYSDLYRKYGFTQLFVSGYNDLQNAISAGFKRDSIMGGISFASSSVDQYGYLKYYHLDEPVENGAYPSYIRWIASYVNGLFPNSLVMMSSYRSPSTWKIYPNGSNGSYQYFYKDQVMNLASNTRIMNDKYTDWFNNPVDQRVDWSDFKNAYGIKNFANWISLDKDHEDGQYGELLGHANNIGINSLWIYSLGSGNSGFIDEFCETAWSNRWLRKFIRKYIYEYHCYSTNCDFCDPSVPEDWYLYKIWDMGQVTEVFPY